MGSPDPIDWSAVSAPEAVADAIVGLYERRGDADYDEILSQTAHARQCGGLARDEGAPDELVVAAFLHDVGHLLTDEPSGPPTRDRRHEDAGARFLARWFPAEVTTPVRLHVAAKRYLCAVDRTYAAGLSAGSTRSLALQGGPMTGDEVAGFEREPGYRDAVALRRWDDLAKVPGAVAPTLDEFRALILDTLP